MQPRRLQQLQPRAQQLLNTTMTVPQEPPHQQKMH
jgi:hypothetical protein